MPTFTPVSLGDVVIATTAFATAGTAFVVLLLKTRFVTKVSYARHGDENTARWREMTKAQEAKDSADLSWRFSIEQRAQLIEGELKLFKQPLDTMNMTLTKIDQRTETTANKTAETAEKIMQLMRDMDHRVTLLEAR